MQIRDTSSSSMGHAHMVGSVLCNLGRVHSNAKRGHSLSQSCRRGLLYDADQAEQADVSQGSLSPELSRTTTPKKQPLWTDRTLMEQRKQWLRSAKNAESSKSSTSIQGRWFWLGVGWYELVKRTSHLCVEAIVRIGSAACRLGSSNDAQGNCRKQPNVILVRAPLLRLLT